MKVENISRIVKIEADIKYKGNTVGYAVRLSNFGENQVTILASRCDLINENQTLQANKYVKIKEGINIVTKKEMLELVNTLENKSVKFVGFTLGTAYGQEYISFLDEVRTIDVGSSLQEFRVNCMYDTNIAGCINETLMRIHIFAGNSNLGQIPIKYYQK